MSHTATYTSTFSEARARVVMHHVLGDFMSVASAGLIRRETIQSWHEELEYAVVNHAIERFQLQLTRPDGTCVALEYIVKDDGTVQEAARAGGIDFHAFSPATRVNLLVCYRAGAPKLEMVKEYLRARNWTTGGSMLDGTVSRDRAYSKDGYGITRNKVGDW